MDYVGQLGRNPPHAAAPDYSFDRRASCDRTEGAARLLRAWDYPTDRKVVCLAVGNHPLLFWQSYRSGATSGQPRASRKSIANCFRECRRELSQACTTTIAP